MLHLSNAPLKVAGQLNGLQEHTIHNVTAPNYSKDDLYSASTWKLESVL